MSVSHARGWNFTYLTARDAPALLNCIRTQYFFVKSLAFLSEVTRLRFPRKSWLCNKHVHFCHTDRQKITFQCNLNSCNVILIQTLHLPQGGKNLLSVLSLANVCKVLITMEMASNWSLADLGSKSSPLLQYVHTLLNVDDLQEVLIGRKTR